MTLIATTTSLSVADARSAGAYAAMEPASPREVPEPFSGHPSLSLAWLDAYDGLRQSVFSYEPGERLDVGDVGNKPRKRRASKPKVAGKPEAKPETAKTMLGILAERHSEYV